MAPTLKKVVLPTCIEPHVIEPVPVSVVVIVPPSPSNDSVGGFCKIAPLTDKVPFTVNVMDDVMVPKVIDAHEVLALLVLVVIIGALVNDTTPICRMSVEVGDVLLGLQFVGVSHAVLLPPFQS
jgi:hypothetical protein